MPHNITALILKGDFDRARAAEFDLFPIDLGFGLSFFHIDNYYSAYWQYKLMTRGALDVGNAPDFCFPEEMSIAEIIKAISVNNEPEFAIIQTDYFGGIGDQHAVVFKGSVNADKTIDMISPALRHLGVTAREGLDEFDTVGLDRIRSPAAFLYKYQELLEEFED